MMSSKPVLLWSLFVVGAACSGGSDGAGEDMEQEGDAGVAALCQPTPSRLVVLGDSISACYGVGDKDASTCGPKIFSESLAGSHAPGVIYENLAVSGAVTADVANRQLATIPTGEGHVLVLIYIGGNDLQTYLSASDAAAESGYEADLPNIRANWQRVFEFFRDTNKFPDGATIIMNNQYNPFDDCTAAPYEFMSPLKNRLLAEYNQELAALADGQDNVFITDQYTPYLGHGHHFAAQSCPHYLEASEPFMEDLIHPNVAGHAHLAAQWTALADTLYEGCESL